MGLWLKSLRLHKYAPLLCHLTYDELLALDEATLEAQGVTKGARHKIVLSIQKLKERHKQLEQIEKVRGETEKATLLYIAVSGNLLMLLA